MEFEKNGVKLRDYKLSDVDDEIYWMNEETCWINADTPWLETEPIDGDKLREEMTEMIISMPENAVRWRFEIEKDGKHIGFVSSYFLNSDYSVVDWDKINEKLGVKENNLIRTLGIEICNEDYWGKGIGAIALELFIDYYKNLGETTFLLETWSGNIRMIKCAAKLNFKEVKRDRAIFEYQGLKYDGIILRKDI